MYLEVKEMKKSYGEGGSYIQVLKGITTGVEKGEMCVIEGTSGSGKSTFLNCIGGLDLLDSGSIVVDGNEIVGMKPDKLSDYRRDNLGFIFQFYNLIPTLTVRKNILMPLLLDKRKVNEEYFEQVVNQLGIADKLEVMPSQLSGGQQQRVAIARALIYRPAILLADEPTGNLDQKNSKEIIEMLKISNRNLEQTIVLITHDEKIALEADRIITIEDGRIVSDQKRR